MKIALLVPGGVDRSGDRRVIPALLALIRRLAAAHEVHVFALRQEREPGDWMLEGARIRNIGTKRTAWRTLAAIRREHRRRSFDVLHCIWSGKLGLLGIVCARLLGIPGLVHVAGGELVCLPEIDYGGCRGPGGRLRESITLRLAAAVTAASTPMIASLNRLGIAAERVPLGVDREFWSPVEPRRRRPDDPLRLIHIGSLNRVKDQTTLLQALAIVAARGVPFHLDIVGEDTLNGAVQSQCTGLGLADWVSFHGFLRQTELRPMLMAAELLLLSSRHEAGPLVVLEAGISGVPTVGTRVGHIAEWDPDAAVAVPPGDAPALAAAVSDLWLDDDRRMRLGREAQLHAIRDDADNCARLFLALYRRVRS